MEAGKVNTLNRVFTRNTVRHFINGNRDSSYTSAVRRYVYSTYEKSNREIIGEIYNVLKQSYRNEYFYKNTLLNKLLLGVHSINTTAALTEIPIAGSKADFVLINGKAVVYEIKSDLDNLDRLGSQIDDYYKAFDHVAVVTHEKNLQHLQKELAAIDKPVGIYVLRKNGKLGTVIKPRRFTESLDKEIIFKLLRKSEFEKILLQKYGSLPEVSQFKYYTACKSLFLQMPVEESYPKVVEILKSRAHIEREDFLKIPYELKFLVYFMELKNADYDKLEVFLNSQYGGM
jgi:hypothetical protein